MLKSAKSDKSVTIRDSELYFFGGNGCPNMEFQKKNERRQLPKSKDLGLCEAYTTGSLHKLKGFLQ